MWWFESCVSCKYLCFSFCFLSSHGKFLESESCVSHFLNSWLFSWGGSSIVLSDWPTDLEETESFILQEWFHSISGSNYEIKFSWEIYWNNCFSKIKLEIWMALGICTSGKSFTIPEPAGTGAPFFHSIKLVPVASRDTAAFIKNQLQLFGLGINTDLQLPGYSDCRPLPRLLSPSECWIEGALWKLPEGHLTPWFFKPRRGCVAAPLCICWTESEKDADEWMEAVSRWY